VGDSWRCDKCGSQPEYTDGFLTFAPALSTTSVGFKEEYFSKLAALEATNFWFRARNDLIVWAMRTYFPQCRSFFEIGCGTGFVLRAIRDEYPTIDLAGGDIFSAGLAFAAARVPSARLYQMDARMIPFRSEFSVIGAFDVLEHIDDDLAVIGQIGGALVSGGGLVVTVPQHKALWSPQDVSAYHVRRYSSRELRRQIETAGFEVIRMTSFVSLLLPMMFASRLRMRWDAVTTESNELAGLDFPPPVKTGFGWVMDMERHLIGLGLSFSAGGSLLMVARKRDQADVLS